MGINQCNDLTDWHTPHNPANGWFVSYSLEPQGHRIGRADVYVHYQDSCCSYHEVREHVFGEHTRTLTQVDDYVVEMFYYFDGEYEETNYHYEGSEVSDYFHIMTDMDTHFPLMDEAMKHAKEL